MFLIERLFGVGVYSVVLLIVCALLTMPNSNIKRIFVGYTIVLAMMAFLYVPYETADLYRINEYLEIYKGYDWNTFASLHLTDQLQLDHIYYWLIAKTGEPRLLPALTTLICYSCVFYIIVKTAKKYDVSRNNVATATFFFMATGTYIFVVAGIRSMLGICLFSFCFFRESVEKKFNLLHLPIYIIVAFIHDFCLVLLLLRLVLQIFTEKTGFLKRIGYLVILICVWLIIKRYFNEYLNGVFDKAEGYLKGDKYSYFWDYCMGVICGIISLLVIWNLKMLSKDKKKQLNGFKYYAIACIIIAIGFCYEFSIFHRTITYILPIIILPLMMTTLQQKEEQTTNGSLLALRRNIALLSIILLVIACSRGSLCSFKLFIL